MNQTFAPPEEGQTVQVRHKMWEVKSVNKSKAPKQDPIHRVGIECISDESLGREIEVVWEREIAPITFEKVSLPEMEGIDTPEMFNSFITALKWSSNSVATEDAFYAPFKSSVKIEDFQHIPLMRSRSMPLVRMLIADDVGFGKTIEAGLILQEMIQSHRASSVLVICPAHLQTKWEEEMADKFGLEFKIINRESIEKMRKDYGPSINPWAFFPRLITSLDYAKKEHPKRLIDELAENRRKDNPRKKPWDILILDEAHNAAPSGQKAYVRDSDKTKLLKSISRYFEHRLFLTATPHNGYRESFTALLELLDELRFSRGSELDPKHRKAVTVRRLKDNIKKPDGSRHFPLRILKPRDEKLDPEFYLDLSSQEQELFDLLEKYTNRRLEKLDKKNRSATNFVLKILKKRTLSSMSAIRKSLEVHLNNLGGNTDSQESEIIINNRISKEDDDFDNDQEKDLAQEEALESSGSILTPLDQEELGWLNRMKKIAEGYDDDSEIIPDTKLVALIKWIEKNLKTNHEWNEERLIIFTEYRHTQDYIFNVLEAQGFGDALQTIFGGMNEKDRKEINKIFQSHPSKHPARILIATDAASEGADFQLYCRNLIHYEIPWNPIRLEQRNGRIDRYGQKAPEVYIHHFIYRNNRDSEFLSRIVDKIDLIRKDLGCVGRIISRSIDKHIAGEEVALDKIEDEQRVQNAIEDLEEDQNEIEDAKEIKEAIEKNRKRFGITEEIQLNILRSALELEGTDTSIVKKDDETFILKNIPISWSECRKFESNDDLECLLTFHRDRAEFNYYEIVVLHLNHPLMQRALRIFRTQMWKSLNLERNAIKRVTIEKSNIIQKPLVIGWGRNRILGIKNNRLHEGLVRVGAYLNDDGLVVLEDEKIDEILSSKRFEYDSDISIIQEKITPLINNLEQIIIEKSEEQFPELEGELIKRGEKFEAQTRALINEQIDQIRKKLKQWDKDQSSTQLIFDFGEEWEDKVSDMNGLRIRLEELYEERKTEPQRLKDENAVLSNRTYPIAYQLIVPSS